MEAQPKTFLRIVSKLDSVSSFQDLNLREHRLDCWQEQERKAAKTWRLFHLPGGLGANGANIETKCGFSTYEILAARFLKD